MVPEPEDIHNVLPSDPAIHASAFFCGNSRSFLYVHFLNAFRKPDRCFRNCIGTPSIGELLSSSRPVL